MDSESLFGKNLIALSQKNPEISARLSGTGTTVSRYLFQESRTGEKIPAWIDPQGKSHPLHSLVDPKREAKRLIESTGSDGFLIFLGLGGGHYVEAALEREDTGMTLVVEYDINGLAGLLRSRDYTRLFADSRFRLTVDASARELEEIILNLYQPVLHGGIRTIPLRARTGLEAELFASASGAISSAIDRISADYSVQAHFGRRWLSNIVRNLKVAEDADHNVTEIDRSAVCAAGPSLSLQIPLLREKREGLFIIATDTSLPCLLNESLTPDAVISIDCQHISYYHFMDGLPEDIPLFLDLASPPLLASRSKRPFFFTGGHPLTRYISQNWKPLPELDTSGGNVTYAALSLAGLLGACEIELYGADFSYPAGVSYARGAYIHSLFAKYQNRLCPLEAQNSSFLYRTPLEKKHLSQPGNSADHWYYETKTLSFYRKKLEEKCHLMEAKLIPVPGLGAPISTGQVKNTRQNPGVISGVRRFPANKATVKAEDFLSGYRDAINRLPMPQKSAAFYLASLDAKGRAVFTTMLPVAAAIKRRQAKATFCELIEETKAHCVREIDAALSFSF